MARTEQQYPLRWSPGLRMQVGLSAAANGRSLNAEIIHLIEAGLAPAEAPRYTAEQVAELLAALEARRIPGEPLPQPDAGLVADVNACLARDGAGALPIGVVRMPGTPVPTTFDLGTIEVDVSGGVIVGRG